MNLKRKSGFEINEAINYVREKHVIMVMLALWSARVIYFLRFGSFLLHNTYSWLLSPSLSLSVSLHCVGSLRFTFKDNLILSVEHYLQIPLLRKLKGEKITNVTSRQIFERASGMRDSCNPFHSNLVI